MRLTASNSSVYKLQFFSYCLQEHFSKIKVLRNALVMDFQEKGTFTRHVHPVILFKCICVNIVVEYSTPLPLFRHSPCASNTDDEIDTKSLFNSKTMDCLLQYYSPLFHLNLHSGARALDKCAGFPSTWGCPSILSPRPHDSPRSRAGGVWLMFLFSLSYGVSGTNGGARKSTF